MAEKTRVSFADEQACREVTFKWAVAWDTKDRALFLSIAAPSVNADYTAFPAVNWRRELKAEEYFDTAFKEENLGNKNLQTHHLLGASSFSHTSATQLTGNWQTYARHVRRFADRRVKEWNSSNVTEFTYVNINGEWKLAGVRPHTVVCVTGEHGDVVGAVE